MRRLGVEAGEFARGCLDERAVGRAAVHNGHLVVAATQLHVVAGHRLGIIGHGQGMKPGRVVANPRVGPTTNQHVAGQLHGHAVIEQEERDRLVVIATIGVPLALVGVVT